ncbi:glucose PTS transporter transcription antiterminator GlcT [Virgibacillus ndiopensis]|uniref:glucose PTS transporter transcription antiterminator GlcT n=1 Tax=Virgibacillus ndiopensis TaxID=2004408 RepID=UPI000C089C7C|nr:PRD domain-containing protein [Virgibacillus ndiopensis]
MEQGIIVQKVLNNNVVIAAHPTYKEVVLIGKGIGFDRKKGDLVPLDIADKTFLLKNEHEKEQYVNLLNYIDKEIIDFMNDVLFYIEERIGQDLNEHIHVALTDHITFAINRVHKNIHFSNPFLFEIESLYPKEYLVAKEVVEMLNTKFAITFPEGEIGFIALHIHSAVTNKSIKDINQHHKLITQLIQVIKDSLEITIEKGNVNYNRLIQHLHRTIERVHLDEKLGKQNNLANMLKKTYPLCYNLAWKLIKVMQKELNREVNETEALYLTIHLQRLTNNI